MPIFAHPLPLSLTWCVLGYMFLGQGESGFAILASMAAITTASLGRESIGAGGRLEVEGFRNP